MNVNFIVSFKRHPQVMFDIELETKHLDYTQMCFQIQLAAHNCLFHNDIDVDDVWKISTASNWTDTWCKEHGDLPNNFNGKFLYGEFREDFLTLEEVLVKNYSVFQTLATMPSMANARRAKETAPTVLM